MMCGYRLTISQHEWLEVQLILLAIFFSHIKKHWFNQITSVILIKIVQGELLHVSCESELSRKYCVSPFNIWNCVRQPLACCLQNLFLYCHYWSFSPRFVMTRWTRIALWAWSWGCCFCRFLKCDVWSGEKHLSWDIILNCAPPTLNAQECSLAGI